MGAACSNFLFHVSDDYNRLHRHNFNFKCTQTIRLINMIASFFLWCILLYVWVKAVFAQLQFYILTLWLISSTKLAWSAGREVVEKKMVERLRDEKLKDGSI